MKISQMHIENFRSIKDLELEFPKSGILTLVGTNNAGKSNILRAINNILGDQWFKGENAELNDFYMKDRSNTIKIEIRFDTGRKVLFNSNEAWPEYYDEYGNKIYSSKGNVKEDFPCTYLPANRSIEKNLQFNRWELMGKIAKSFNEKASCKKTEIENQFNKIIEIFDSLNEFKEFKEDFIRFFEELQSDSPYKLKIDFKAFTPLNYFKSINILANDTSINDNYDIAIEELGDGNKNLILFALIRSYAKNFKKEAQGILAIEEPEIYLHPQARRHLYSVFKEIVKDSNIQIIITTHSASFINTEEFYQIGLVSKCSSQGTKVKIVKKEDLVDFCQNTSVPKDRTSAGNISEFYSTTSNYRLNEAFFSKFLILVEGETEEMAIPTHLEKAGVRCDYSGISIIGVGGKNQIPKYWRLFKSFGLPLLIVFDNDNSPEKKKSNENLASCFNCDNTDFLTDCVIYKEIKTNRKGIYEQLLIVLENDFETAIKKDLEKYCNENSIECKYDEFRNEALKTIKPLKDTQKGQVARYIAKKVCDFYPGYVPAFIEAIKQFFNNEQDSQHAKKIHESNTKDEAGLF